MTRTFAAADIGSNTAHLLVAATDGKLVMRIDNFNEWIPLGEVVARYRRIPKEMVAQLVNAVREFKRVASAKQAESLYVFATEGIRAAENHDSVIKRIKAQTGISVEIVSAAREADLSLRGMYLDTRHHRTDLMFEVGGGSVQIGRVAGNRLAHTESLPIGTGRVIAASGLQNPCPDVAFMAAENFIDSVLQLETIGGSARIAVAIGGVGRGLWRALHPDSEKVLSIEEIEYIVWATRRLATDRIVARFGVKPKRAGTLLPGALVYRALMRKFDVSEIVVSEFGIREGAILEMAAGKIAGFRI
jgi:exopolyphosphatase/guanosine-5'-triphosphate,3'-diphosphate pyrophosphatase